jgi:transposase, IS6 family
MRRNRPALFKGRHFEAHVIILCVRRYLRFSLSLRDVEELMAERNLGVDHVTIWRWFSGTHPNWNGAVGENSA